MTKKNRITLDEIRQQKKEEQRRIKESGEEFLKKNLSFQEKELEIQKEMLRAENVYIQRKSSKVLPKPMTNEFDTFTGILQMDGMAYEEVRTRIRELKVADKAFNMHEELVSLGKNYYKALASNASSSYQADERRTILLDSIKSIWELHKMKRMLRLPCYLKIDKEIQIEPQGCKGHFLFECKNKEQELRDCWAAYPQNKTPSRPRVEIFFDEESYKWKARLKMPRLQRMRNLSGKHYVLAFLYSLRGIWIAVLNVDTNRYEKPEFLDFTEIFEKRRKLLVRKGLTDINNLNAGTHFFLQTEIGNFLKKIDMRFNGDLVQWRMVHFIPSISGRLGKQWNRTLNSLRQTRMLYFILAKYSYIRNEGLVEYVKRSRNCPACKSSDTLIGTTFQCNSCGKKINNKYLAIAENGCLN